MPYELRCLIVVLVVSGVMFAIVRPMFQPLIAVETLNRWIAVWISATFVGFVIPDFWVMSLALVAIVFLLTRNSDDKPVFYLLLLMALPAAGNMIPGFLGINRFFAPTPQVYFAALFLLPVLFAKRSDNHHYKRQSADRLIVFYLVLISVLTLRDGSITAMMRNVVIYFFGIILPYFALAKWPRDADDIRKIIIAFLLPLFGLALIGLVESVKIWNVYRHLPAFWGIPGQIDGNLFRNGLLRAYGPAGGPIPFGYLFMVGTGLLLALRASLFRGRQRYILIGILLLGLGVSGSRGPMVGLAATFFVYLVMSEAKFRTFGRLAMVGLIFVIPLMFTSVGQGLISYVPFIGEIDPGSVSYRSRLFENSMTVIMRNPLFGSVDFLKQPEMIAMTQGQGIIDLVNSYIQVALEYGLIGLLLFAGVFLSIVRGLLRVIRALPDEQADLKQLGVGLLATLSGVLVTIATVSSIDIVPILYWSLAGLSVSYIRIASRSLQEFATVTPKDDWAPVYASRQRFEEPVG